jgi:hypoxanthine phosphoribosyltransferase
MGLSEESLYDAVAIAARVRELAAELDVAFAGGPVVAVVALKGAMVFAADLIRAMKTPIELEMIRAKSYAGTESTGEVTFSLVPEGDLLGKTVLVIEDIIDTGRTARAIYGQLLKQYAKRVHVVTLLDKPSRREVDFEADWVGFSIEDVFVVGYGMDCDERYRELGDIRVLKN